MVGLVDFAVAMAEKRLMSTTTSLPNVRAIPWQVHDAHERRPVLELPCERVARNGAGDYRERKRERMLCGARVVKAVSCSRWM